MLPKISGIYHFFHILLFFLFSQIAFSATQDSLLLQYNNAQHDTSRTNVLLKISETLRKTKPDSALAAAKSAEKLSLKAGFISGQIYSLLRQGQAYTELSNYAEALKVLLKSKDYAERTANFIAAGYAMNAMGNIYFYQKDYVQAKVNYNEALKTARQQKELLLMGYCLNNLGRIAFDQADYNEAEKNFLEGLQIQQVLKNSNGQALGYLNLGLTYYDQKKIFEAREAFLKVLDIYKTAAADKDILISTNNALGVYYEEKKEFPRAIEYLNTSLRLAQELKNKKQTAEVYTLLSDVYSDAGDHKKALEYHKLYAAWKDSLRNEANNKAFKEVQAKYESQEKDNKIYLLKKETEINEKAQEKERKYWTIGYILLFLILTFIVVIYFQKRGSNKTLVKKNEEIELQKSIIEKKNENIIDSINYAKHIQQSLRIHESEVRECLPELFIIDQPKDIVSGDFYWYTKLGIKNILVVADCTGHGVPGAFMSAIGNLLLNDIIKHSGVTNPGEILSKLHFSICNTLNQHKSINKAQDGMEISICTFDDNAKVLQYAGAGHPLYMIHHDELIITAPNRHSLGGMLPGETSAIRKYTTHELEIDTTTKVYMLSDGFTDQFGGPERLKFGSRKFMELIESLKEVPITEQKEKILENLYSWKGKTSQIDDILVVGFKPVG